MATPTLSNVSVSSESNYLVVSWSATNQAGFKVSVYGGGSRGQAPDYGTIRTSGQSLTRGSHYVYNPNTRRVRFDGNLPSSGRVCNGTYEVRMKIISTTNVESAVVSRVQGITGVPCEGAGYTRYILPAPTILTPNSDTATIDGQNVVVAWNLPAGYSQAGYKVAIYRRGDIDLSGEPKPGTKPVYGTIREEQHRNSATRSHWANGAIRNITFSDTSPHTNNQIKDGSWTARLRFRNSAREESRAAVRHFTVQNVGAYTSPEDVGVPAAGQGTGVHWPVTSLAHNVLLPLRLDWNSVFPSGEGQRSFRLRRNLSGQSAYAGDYWYHLPDSQGEEWNNRGVAYNSTSNEIRSAATEVVLSGRSEPYSTSQVITDEDWGEPSWGLHRFYVTATDRVGNTSAESGALEVTPYWPLQFNGIAVAYVAPANNVTEHLRVTNNLTGRIDNNAIAAVKIAVYDRTAWDASSVENRPAPVGGTREWWGQRIDDEIGARWVTVQEMLDNNELTGITTALNQQLTGFYLNCGSRHFQCPRGSSNLVIRAKLRDHYGNETQTEQQTFTYTPTELLNVNALPVRIVSPDVGTTALTTAAPLTGLSAGVGVAVLTYWPAGEDTSQTDRLSQIREVWRREHSRSDDRPPDQTPRFLHSIDTFAPERTDPLPTWITGVSLATGSSPYWYLDYEVEEGVQYQYQVRQVAFSGAVKTSAWAPA